MTITAVVYREMVRSNNSEPSPTSSSDAATSVITSSEQASGEATIAPVVDRDGADDPPKRETAESEPEAPPKLTDFDDSSRLSRIKWSIAHQIPNHRKVLASEYFNPEGKSFSEESSRELDRILEDLSKREKEFESAYNNERRAHMKSRLAEGRYEVQALGDAGLAQSRPTNPEEEVLGISSTKYGNAIVRVNWGDSPFIDQKRQEVLDFKTRSVAAVRDFVKENAK